MITELEGIIPRKTGKMATAFLNEFRQEAAGFALDKREFTINLEMISPEYTKHNFKNLEDWKNLILQKFDFYFDVQTRTNGMEAI